MHDRSGPAAPVVSRRRAIARRAARRLLVAGSVVCGLIVVVVGSGLLYLNWRFGQFGRVEIEREVLARPGVTRPVDAPIPTVPITEPPPTTQPPPGVTTTAAPPTTEEPEVTVPA